MRIYRTIPYQGRPGVGPVTLEFALLTPVLLLLLLGILEVGRLVQIQQVVDNAAREGGRQASTGKYDEAQVEDAVRDYLANAGMPTTGVTVTVTNDDGPTVLGEVYVAGGAQQMDRLRVEVSYPYANIQYLGSRFFVPADAELHSTACWRNMADIPVTVTTTIPSQPLP